MRGYKTNAKELYNMQKVENQKPVDEITISIEWKKSKVYGYNPHADAVIVYKDGTRGYMYNITCSGCGYDKGSTVIADIFDATLKYKYNDPSSNITNENSPYGIHICGGYISFSGGIGVSCYFKIAEALGGKFECIVSGDKHDVYRYTDSI
jgi:hypothetical protein